MCRFIFSILLCVPLWAFGQALERPKPIKPKPDFMPSAVRVGADLYALGNALFTEGKTKYELQGDIDFHHYFFNLDLGFEENIRQGANFDYLSSGSFFRAGVDIDLMPYNQERSTIFLGLRYAATTFREDLTYRLNDSIWQDVSELRSSNRNLSGRWIELVAGMKVRVYQRLFMGYTARYKIYKRINGSPVLDTYDLPGFGLGRKNTHLDFSFYVYYRLAFRYKQIPEKPK